MLNHVTIMGKGGRCKRMDGRSMTSSKSSGKTISDLPGEVWKKERRDWAFLNQHKERSKV